jgi:2-methylcitrate dehydratase PrpD
MSPLPATRRAFLQFSAAAAGTLLAGTSRARAAASGEVNKLSSPEGVTRRLARFLVSARAEDVPDKVRHEAVRTLVNFLGVAIGGAHHESVDAVLAAIAPFSGAAQAQVLGRRERLDVMHAALVNGVSSHVLNFDDTHLKTIIHASSSIVPPALALSEYLPDVSGRALVHALVLGMETAFRVGGAVSPEHFDAGWHITGTAGAIGAAATSGRLLGLSEQQMIWALGLAASQPVGLRESFGSMNKSFNPGRAAQNGLLAALLAARNFTSSEQMLEAKAGWARTVSSKQNFHAITDDLGVRFEAAQNTYLPFACAIILHPAIDGCLRLREQHRLNAAEITTIDLRVHPRVLQLAANPKPATGLEGKFSVHHAAAIAFVAGKAGPRQFTDEAVREAGTIALRERVTLSIDHTLEETQARITVTLRDGRTVTTFVEHVMGSLENPLSDAALTAKAKDVMEGCLPAEQISALLAAAWNIVGEPAASIVARHAASRRAPM